MRPLGERQTLIGNGRQDAGRDANCITKRAAVFLGQLPGSSRRAALARLPSDTERTAS
jgi:hypothetical protein